MQAVWFGRCSASRRGLAVVAAVTTQMRSCASSSSSSVSDSGSAKTAAPKRGFVSGTKFSLAPSQVTDENVPTARDVAAMIPTLKELKAQLPEARELESKYIGGLEAATNPSKDTASGLFQTTTDPLEDFIDGNLSDSTQKPNRTHVLLAYRALFWGTVYAVVGVSVTVIFAMFCCGYHSIGALMDGVRDKVARDEARLRTSAEQKSAAGETVTHYVIDLTRPSVAMEQMREIWTAVQNLAEEEAKQEDVASSSKRE